MSEYLKHRQPYPPVIHVRPRSAAALAPAEDDPGVEVVERLLQLTRRMLP